MRTNTGAPDIQHTNYRQVSVHQGGADTKEKNDPSPYNENLLDFARTQWQLGEWGGLIKIEQENLQDHPDRAKLAMLVAAGHLHTNNIHAAKKYIRISQEWGGSNKLISQILIASVHNTLGRVSAVAGQHIRALKHFEDAISIVTPGADQRLLTRARIVGQITQLGLPAEPFGIQLGAAIHAPTSQEGCTFKVNRLAKHNLGNAWAGNTINTVIFRHHGILTIGQNQYTAFYVDEHTLRLVLRDLEADSIQTHNIVGEFNLRDAHNSISLGIDREGYLHISYDHHATRLRYRRAIRPHSIIEWTDELPMTGAHEEKITYPTFILPRQGLPLTLLYRDGVHNKGTARIKTYDEISQTWADHPTPILSGAEQKPWTSNAYWNHPAIGSDGSLHLTFVWRTHALGEEELINNVNIGYACSTDNGLTWHTSRNRPYKLPITQVNAETIFPASPGSNLINQTSMALDSRNRPHIVFYADDSNGIPQYQHLWFDGKEWHHQIISGRRQAFRLHGHGTLQIPISRPEIVIDRKDNVYVIYRGDLTNNRMAVTLLPAPTYLTSTDETQPLWDEDLGFAEPIIDRTRWQRDNILSLLLQRNEQPNHDIGHQALLHPITLIDINLKSGI